MTDLSQLLNPEQFEAATAPDGPLLILAAAGTGKTRTLVYRVVHLIERGFAPEQILLLTFTNRAAREMLQRAEAVTTGLTNGLWGGTFHSVANRMLRHYAPAIGFGRDFQILDADDQKTLMAQCIRTFGFKPKEFPKKELVLSLLSGAINRNLAVEEYLEKRAADYDVDPADILRVMREYVRLKQERGAMDFDDLLVNALRLLQTSADARSRYQEQFRHVLVDEYQDTNILQSGFVDLLASRHRNLSVVGDDYQCIYSWRGSDYRNIMQFPERYPDAKIVKLERNYRSRPPILALANASIRHNAEQFDKTLRATRTDETYRPELIDVDSARDQGAEVVRIVREVEAAGYGPDEIAVLYRSHFHALDTQLALAKAHVPFTITSGTSFYEQAHVKDVLSVLRLAENPADRLSFERVLPLLPGVGETGAQRIWEKLGGSFDSADSRQREALLAMLPPRARPAWEPVGDALGAYHAGVFPKKVKDLFTAFLESFYASYMKKEFENCDERTEEIEELAADIASRPSVRAFLEDVALLTNLDRGAVSGAQASSVPKILMSTIHQAKGLEWKVVVLLGLAEGLFPSSRALEDDMGDEEERRLFYVAVTRARDRLFLLRPHCRMSPDGGIFRCEGSRFLSEVGDNLFSGVDRRSAVPRWGGPFGRRPLPGFYGTEEPAYTPGGGRYGSHVKFNW